MEDSVSKKTAVISGVKGQDGSYLAEFLLEKQYKVVGIEHSSGSSNYGNIKHLMDNPNFILEQGDITDISSIVRILKQHEPDEFYNLAAQSCVAASWDKSISTCTTNFIGTCNCLEAIKLTSPRTRFFQASTSEVYGYCSDYTQDESTPASPRSPYAASKYGAEHLVKVYRESYSMFACFGRLFNHESPRRHNQFVTKKITSWIGHSFNIVENSTVLQFAGSVSIHDSASMFISTQDAFDEALKQKLISPLHLGNLDSKRDWSHAKDIVRGMWLMLQQDTPDDYVFASGTTRSVKDFLTEAFGTIGVNNWEKFVFVNSDFYRPTDITRLCGDYTKAYEKLGWKPEITFKSLVKEMVDSDINNV